MNSSTIAVRAAWLSTLVAAICHAATAGAASTVTIHTNWWALHNSPFDGNIDASLYGSCGFGDYGVLSRGMTSSNGAIEPAAETPFPAYYGLQMLSYLGDAWDTILKVESSTDLVSAHAVTQLNGRVNVMLVNKDPNVALTVNVSLEPGRARGLAHVFAYGKKDTTISRSAEIAPS